MADISKRIGRNVRRLREERQLSQEQLGELSGLHRVYLGRIERGEVNPTVRILTRLAKAFHVDVSELLRPLE